MTEYLVRVPITVFQLHAFHWKCYFVDHPWKGNHRLRCQSGAAACSLCDTEEQAMMGIESVYPGFPFSDNASNDNLCLLHPI